MGAVQAASTEYAGLQQLNPLQHTGILKPLEGQLTLVAVAQAVLADLVKHMVCCVAY
jgi:hypothetical protein